jgi:ABC-2 type transport system permease protein
VIARLLAYPRLDLLTSWRRPMNIVMLVVFAFMSFGLYAGNVQVGSGSADTGGAKVALNSAFNIAFVDVILCALMLPFFVAVACGMPALTDGERRVMPLVSATPLTHMQYALSRFAGAMTVLLLILALWTLVQMAIFELAPIDENERTRGAFSLWAYVGPLVMIVLPMATFVGGVSMWLGARTRQPVLVFALPVVILVTGVFFVWVFNPEWLPRWIDRSMQAIDPTGFRWFGRTYMDEDRGVAFYNSAAVVPDALFASSRIALAAVGVAFVWLSGRRLEWEARRDRRIGNAAALIGAARAADGAAAGAHATEHAAIAARGAAPASTVRVPGFVGTTLGILQIELRALLRSPGVWLFGPLILLQTAGNAAFDLGPLGTWLLVTSGSAAAGSFNTLTMLLCLLTLFYTVESLVREERCGMSGIFRATPIPTSAVLAGKVLANAALAVVIIGCAAAAIAIVLVVQFFQTGIMMPLELPTMLLILGVLLAPTLVVWCAFVALLYALLRNRFVVYGVALAALIGTGLATQFGYMNWLTAWHMWSAVRWSELDRLAFMWDAIVANRVAVLLLAALLVALTLQFWPRRTPDLRAVADRFRPWPLFRAALIPVAAAIPLIVVASYMGLKIRAGYEGRPAESAQKAYWTRNSRTWEDVPVPALDRVDGEVKLFPASRELEVAATMVIRNPHRTPMAEVPVTVGPHFESSDWMVDGVATDPTLKDQVPPCIEDRSGLYVITPKAPLRTDQTVTISFRLKGAYPDGWSRFGAGAGEFLLPSGAVLTSFSASFLPVVGYVEGVGVNGTNSRDAREYPLDHWKGRVDPAFGPAWPTQVRLAVEAPEEWTVNVVGVARESSVADGRRRTVWETEHPVRFFNIVGGPLEAAKGKTSTIYHSARTPHNVATMVEALDDARARYSEWFGPYPWENLRVTEFPGLAGYAQGFPGNITFSETIGYLSRPVEKGDEGTFDAAYYIVAHESGHQWWGNIVMPGKGPGGNIISEGLAEFSALMLLHHERGEGQAKVLRRRWEQEYLEGRSADNERPINRVTGTRPGDSVVTYQRAGLVFWMLRGLVGEEAMLAGLRDFVVTWKDGVQTPEGLDFPLIEDLLVSLRAHAPDVVAFDAFTSQWILGKALPELELDELSVSGGGSEWVTAASLSNVGTGSADVTVRVWGKEPEGEGERPRQDVRVRITPGASSPVEVKTNFAPDRIEVDPGAELLFSGRKRCERGLPGLGAAVTAGRGQGVS